MGLTVNRQMTKKLIVNRQKRNILQLTIRKPIITVIQMSQIPLIKNGYFFESPPTSSLGSRRLIRLPITLGVRSNCAS